MAVKSEVRAKGGRMTLRDLESQLRGARIDYSGWGTIPGSKPIGKLLDGINGGDFRLNEAGGRLVREVEQGGGVMVARDPSGSLKVLREDRQVFDDGRVRRRNMEGVSFREKLDLTKEGFNQAVWRGMREELPEIFAIESQRDWRSTTNPLLRVDSYRRPQILVEGENYVSSFPGLANQSMEYRYSMVISPEAYKPEGYVTKEKDKTTYFVWQEAERSHPFLPTTDWQMLTLQEMEEVIGKTRTRIQDRPEIQPAVAAEYLHLKRRLEQLSAREEPEYGSRPELEMAATAFRIFDLERMIPQLKRLNVW